MRCFLSLKITNFCSNESLGFTFTFHRQSRLFLSCAKPWFSYHSDDPNHCSPLWLLILARSQRAMWIFSSLISREVHIWNVVVAVLGKLVPAKTDEFSEKFQTAVDPPPLIFGNRSKNSSVLVGTSYICLRRIIARGAAMAIHLLLAHPMLLVILKVQYLEKKDAERGKGKMMQWGLRGTPSSLISSPTGSIC